MEIKAELLKPYTEQEKLNFIVKENHENGYEIKETEQALQSWGSTIEEDNQQEQERIAKLHLTKREVFLGLRKARNVMPEQIRAQITDPDALIEFDYATEYYRGNPLIDMVGGALGITPEQLDKFFETNNYEELLPKEEIINPGTVDNSAPLETETQLQLEFPQ